LSDWIEQLERLTRLHKDGALTDAEFAEQKARLLEDRPAAAAPVAPEPATPVEEYDEPPAKSRVPLFVALGLGAAAVLGAAAWYGSSAVPDSELVKASTGPTAVASDALAATEAPAPTPTPVAIDGTLAFSSPSSCGAGETLERVYKKLEAGMDLGSGSGLSVTLDAFDTPLAITAKSGTDKEGAQTANADLRFPAETTWHGLKLSRLTTSRYYPPESDGADTRTVNFLDPPEKVKKTLARLGFGVPIAPDYAEITSTNECGGSMQIEKRPGGSALVCTRGC
jgi:Short C-terminal domain